MQWRFAHRARRPASEPIDPGDMLGWLMIMATALIAVLAAVLPTTVLLPALSLVALSTAAVAALVAWLIGAKRDARRVTAWDICGGLALIGFVAGMLSEPSHILQLVGVTTTTL